MATTQDALVMSPDAPVWRRSLSGLPFRVLAVAIDAMALLLIVPYRRDLIVGLAGCAVIGAGAASIRRSVIVIPATVLRFALIMIVVGVADDHRSGRLLLVMLAQSGGLILALGIGLEWRQASDPQRREQDIMIALALIVMFEATAVFVGLQGRLGGALWIGLGLPVGALTPVLVHELSHALVAWRLGHRVTEVHLGSGAVVFSAGIFRLRAFPVLAGLTQFDEAALTPRRHALIAVAGPVGNLLTGAVLLMLDVPSLVLPLGWWHIGLAVQSLLPLGLQQQHSDGLVIIHALTPAHRR